MNVVGYARVSTEEQARDGVSLGAQEDKIHAYAVVKDWALAELSRDAGHSAKSLAARYGATARPRRGRAGGRRDVLQARSPDPQHGRKIA